MKRWHQGAMPEATIDHCRWNKLFQPYQSHLDDGCFVPPSFGFSLVFSGGIFRDIWYKTKPPLLPKKLRINKRKQEMSFSISLLTNPWLILQLFRVRLSILHVVWNLCTRSIVTFLHACSIQTKKIPVFHSALFLSKAALLTYTSIYLPFVLAMAHASISSRNSTRQIYETSTVVSAFSMTIGLSEMTTQLLKLLIQRRRPNFYQLCQFDPQTKACIASLENLREANFSFPSGHSSLAMCGMTFLVWYGLGKLSNSTIGNKTAGCTRLKSLAIMVIPWGWAVFVGASRLIDKWHHYSDVVAGLLLGFSACTITYHTWYPPVWVSSAGIPRVLLEEFQPFENHLKLPTFSE